jgi:ribonuclease BN (tRNA processing enzyme)
MPAAMYEGVSRHLSAHHLSPEQVGEMAGRARVGRVVVTHIVPGSPSDADVARYKAAIARNFTGPAEIADDLDRF